MGQGSGSPSSAPHIVDEEALALVGKCKGKANKKKGHKDTLHPSAQEEEEQYPDVKIYRGGGVQQKLQQRHFL